MAGSGDGCAFCDIARGEQEAAIVGSDDHSVAFLDRSPLFHGHVLLVPRLHVPTLASLPAELVGPLFIRAQQLEGAVVRAMDAGGSFVAINNQVSRSVPHLHIHIVPRRRGDGLRGFFWPRTRYDGRGELASVAARIRAALDDAR